MSWFVFNQRNSSAFKYTFFSSSISLEPATFHLGLCELSHLPITPKCLCFRDGQKEEWGHQLRGGQPRARHPTAGGRYHVNNSVITKHTKSLCAILGNII